MALFGLLSRFVLSLLLWPLAGCLALALGRAAWGLPWSRLPLAAFAAGFGAYALVQAFFWKPLFVYVMGHELTHALAAVLQGGRADDLHVSTKGGQVKVNRSNFLVNLAPYFFPLYTAMAALVYLIAAEPYKPALVFLLGFTLAFHLALTVYSLRQHQSDIAEVGWLFALPFIAVLNLLIAAAVLVLVGAPLSLKTVLLDAWAAARGAAQWVVVRI